MASSKPIVSGRSFGLRLPVGLARQPVCTGQRSGPRPATRAHGRCRGVFVRAAASGAVASAAQPQQPFNGKTNNPALLGSAAAVGSAVLISRMLGMVREMSVASAFGVTVVADAFGYACQLPNFFTGSIGALNGPIHNALSPLLNRSRSKPVDRLVLGQVVFTVLLVGLGVTALVAGASSAVLSGLAPALLNSSQATFASADLMLRILAPSAVISGVCGIAIAVLASQELYLLAAASPALISICQILSVNFRPLLVGALGSAVNASGVVTDSTVMASGTLAGYTVQCLVLCTAALLSPGFKRLISQAPAAEPSTSKPSTRSPSSSKQRTATNASDLPGSPLPSQQQQAQHQAQTATSMSASSSTSSTSPSLSSPQHQEQQQQHQPASSWLWLLPGHEAHQALKLILSATVSTMVFYMTSWVDLTLASNVPGAAAAWNYSVLVAFTPTAIVGTAMTTPLASHVARVLMEQARRVAYHKAMDRKREAAAAAAAAAAEAAPATPAASLMSTAPSLMSLSYDATASSLTSYDAASTTQTQTTSSTAFSTGQQQQPPAEAAAGAHGGTGVTTSSSSTRSSAVSTLVLAPPPHKEEVVVESIATTSGVHTAPGMSEAQEARSNGHAGNGNGNGNGHATGQRELPVQGYATTTSSAAGHTGEGPASSSSPHAVPPADPHAGPHAVGMAMLLCSVVAVPVSACVYALATPLVQLLFQRQSFTAEATQLVAAMTQGMAIATFPYTLREVLLRAVYALQDASTPFQVSLLAMSVKLCIGWLMIVQLQLGPAAIPWGSVASNSAALYLVATRLAGHVPGLLSRERVAKCAVHAGRIVLATVACVVASRGAFSSLQGALQGGGAAATPIPTAALSGGMQLVLLGLATATGLAVYAATLRICGLDFEVLRV